MAASPLPLSHISVAQLAPSSSSSSSSLPPSATAAPNPIPTPTTPSATPLATRGTTTSTTTTTTTTTPTSTTTTTTRQSFQDPRPPRDQTSDPDLDSDPDRKSRPPLVPETDTITSALLAQAPTLPSAVRLPPPSAYSLLPAAAAAAPPAASSNDSATRPKHHQSTPSTGFSLAHKAGLLNLAALAIDRTTSAIASLSEPSIRQRASASSLYRSAQTSPSKQVNNNNTRRSSSKIRTPDFDPSSSDLSRSSNTYSASQLSHARTASSLTSKNRQSLWETNPPSQPYADTSPHTQAPINFVPQGKSANKMHQTSSRLLRMTSDERPFTRDFKDLFATLVVSLPLAKHRIRLTSVEHTFISEEAINNLGSLKFSQSNRMPDPKDPSRIVTTTTTTTFSMAREMARSVCQRFLDARFIETADGKQGKEFKMQGATWQLTPKGIHVLERFCSKNGIQQKHVSELINSSRNTMQLVILERDSATDKLSSDRSTVEVIFRRFIGTNGPNVKTSISSADSDSLSEYKDGIAGVKMASERKVGSPPRTVYQTFTGKAATDWLMDCCTTVDRRETSEIASLFLVNDFIWCVQSDRALLQQLAHDNKEPADAKVVFQSSKLAIYQLTQKGKDVLNMTSTRERHSESDGGAGSRSTVPRDSNTQKLDKILNDAALRLLFRENLRDTHCEENLSFYLDVDEFLRNCKSAIKSNAALARNSTAAGSNAASQALDSVKETMASAYGIYNAFLAPGSPCELNIDHSLRNQLATRMTKAVGQDAAMVESLKEVTQLFEDAQISVFKLMASDSVPKFMKSSKYEQTLKNYDFDSLATRFHSSNHMPERSMSRSQPPNR